MAYVDVILVAPPEPHPWRTSVSGVNFVIEHPRGGASLFVAVLLCFGEAALFTVVVVGGLRLVILGLYRLLTGQRSASDYRDQSQRRTP